MSAAMTNFTGWLALRLDSRGSYRPGLMRLTKTRPGLRSDEIAVELKLSVPQALFTKPTLRIEAEVPEGTSIAAEIPAELQSNIAELIAQQTGLRIEIAVPEEEE